MTKRYGLRYGVVILAVLLIGAAGLSYARGSELPRETVSPAPQGMLGTSFTYQGQLKSGSDPVNDSCSVQFGLYDAIGLGNQIGISQTESITVTDGLFSAKLDFGEVFTGTARWLGVAVKCGGEGSYSSLGRQELTAAPYALYAQGAPWSGVTGLPAGFADNTDDADDQVSWDEISGIAGTGPNQVAPGIHSHAGSDVTSAVPTATLALSATQVSWSGLTDLPAGFADGVDNDTTYTPGAGLALDGFEFSARGSAYDNVIIVAKSGGDFGSVQSALDSIADASASNRYLVWVAPGVYSEAVTMKQFVDIEGSGELATKITASGSTTHTIATVLGANDAELRFLTVENTGGAEYAVAIYNDNASPTLTHVTLIASGAVRGHGMYNDSSSPTMTEMVISVSASGTSWNYGVLNHDNSLPTMRDLTISVSGGGGSGTNYGVLNESSHPTMMDVTISSKNNYGNVGVANDSSGPTMMDMTITASGGGFYNTGVYNSNSSSPTMIDVIVSGSGGDYGRGVHSDNSELTMRNITATGSDGSLHNRGLWLVDSPAMIQNSSINAYGTAGIGIINESGGSSYTMHIDHCQIAGSVNAILNHAQYTTYVGASFLSGGVVNASGGTVTCAGVYDENYTFSPDVCP